MDRSIVQTCSVDITHFLVMCLNVQVRTKVTNAAEAENMSVDKNVLSSRDIW